ncbi:cadherin domain-containing protein, partial [Opitutales bacterium]|nr:cadherin domain-containing protein [Opitutales bacterium]
MLSKSLLDAIFPLLALRVRQVGFFVLILALNGKNILGQSNLSQIGYNQSSNFNLNTINPIQIGFANSLSFQLKTNNGVNLSHSGSANSSGFALNTMAGIQPSSTFDFGFSDSIGFILDTSAGTAASSISDQIGFSDSDTFSVDTRNSSALANVGYGDSGGFILDTGGNAGANIPGFALSGKFSLNTTSSSMGSISSSLIGFADSFSFELNTTNPNPNQPTPVNSPPTFQVNGIITVPENQTLIFDFNASDPDNDPLSYSILLGIDKQFFELNQTTGLLSFYSPKDFENPTDNNSDNIYELTIQVSDGDANVSLNTFVHVSDINETNNINNLFVQVSGYVHYDGVVSGPAIVWALESNGSKAAEYILPDGNGSYSLSVIKNRAYDFKVFVDGSQNGYPTTGEVWKHYGDWNSSINSFNLTQVDNNLTGIDFNLWDLDYDNDGFLNWHEYLAGTQENNASSTPVIEFGMLAHWKFDETNGTILHDSSVNKLNGTLIGFNNPWSPGRVGGSLRFDGVDDHISFAGITELNDIRPISFSGWLKLDQNGSGYVFAKRSEGHGYWRFFASGPSKNWLIRSTTGNSPSIQSTEFTPFFQWQHIALTWNGLLGGQNSRIFIDGIEKMNINQTAGSGQIISDAGNLFTIGNRPQNNSSFFKGWMDDFRIWNRVITQNEIQALYQGSPETNATISGNITNTTSVLGPIIIRAYDESGLKIAQQTLSGGPGSYSISLPTGHSYDIKAFTDGNQDGELNPGIGEPYSHFGNWNGNGHNLLGLEGNLTAININLNYETDQDNDGYSLWEETQAGTDDNNPNSIPNTTPYDLNASSLTFNENLSIGSIVTTFSATDPDSNSLLSYWLTTPGVNSANNSLFSLNATTGILYTASNFDYENNSTSYLLRIKAKDEKNASIESYFTINLADNNDLPIIHSVNRQTTSAIFNYQLASSLYDEIQIPENTSINLEINASDQDADPLSFVKTAGEDRNLFDFNSSTGIFSLNVIPDYEVPVDQDQNNTYDIWF